MSIVLLLILGVALFVAATVLDRTAAVGTIIIIAAVLLFTLAVTAVRPAPAPAWKGCVSCAVDAP